MKRTLLFRTRTITSLVVLLMTLPVWGNDGDTFTEETVEGVMLTYTIISEAEKTCMVGEKYHWPVPGARANKVKKASESQPSGDITIPEAANGYAVVHIEAYALGNAAITSVVIPNSVKTIGIAAFSGCSDLKSVKLSNQLTTIGYATFQDCANLTSIDIPEGVTSIGDDAFYGCRQLKEATIPASVVHFGKNVFCSTGFTSMPKLPEGLTTIPYGIFQSCPLTSVEIPQNITMIDGCAFNACPISEIEIPASVTHIGVAAFARCKNLTSLVIPDNVTDIDFNAFKWCSNLKTVTLSNNLSSLSEGIFSDCSSLESINIPSGVKTIGNSAFWGCSSLRSISIPEAVESIDENTFLGCSSLTSVTIGSKVKSIDMWAFAECENLVDFYCRAENVPETKTSTFKRTNIENVTLHVPAASLDAYRNVSPWNQFGAIVPLETEMAYRPMLKDGKVWNCYYSNGFSRFKMVFYLDGDSIVDGDRCFKMYLTMTEMETGTNLAKDGYYGLFLEKDGKVYEMRNGSNSWTQLYDFTMKVGDVMVPGKDYSLTVKAIDSVYVAGQAFRRMTLNTVYYYYGEREDPYVYDGYWVEGVGSPSGPTIPNNCYTPGGSNQLLSCYEDGECIFADNDFWRKGGEDSETYKPIFQEGLTWKMEYQKDSSPESRCETLVLINSTLIDDIPYKRVYTQEKAGDSDDYIWTPQEYWIGEKDGRVYYYRSGWHDHYTPIMDFSLSVGDSLVVTYVLPDDFERNIHELQTYRVVAVSDTVIDSSTDKCPRRCVYVEGKYGDEKDCWVEGIGSLKYGINVIKIQGSSDTSQSLLSCTRGDELLYYRSQEVNEIRNHSAVFKSDSARSLFDLQGRQLQGKPQRGVYIHDGRKVVIK